MFTNKTEADHTMKNFTLYRQGLALFVGILIAGAVYQSNWHTASSTPSSISSMKLSAVSTELSSVAFMSYIEQTSSEVEQAQKTSRKDKSRDYWEYIWHDKVRPHPFGDFLGGDFNGSSEYAKNAISLDKKVKIEQGSNVIVSYIDPDDPLPRNKAHDRNFRAEIRRTPWHPQNMPTGQKIQKGYEHWLGWTFKFPEDYVWDEEHEHSIFQYHSGKHSPNLNIKIRNRDKIDGKAYRGHMIYQQNWGEDAKPTKRGTQSPVQLPKIEAGKTYSFVLHVIAHDSKSGKSLVELWINGKRYVNSRHPVLFNNVRHYPTPKWGFYSFRWRNSSAAKESAKLGVVDRKIYIGPIREVKRNPDHVNYKKDAYDQVKPRIEAGSVAIEPESSVVIKLVPNPAVNRTRLILEGAWDGRFQVTVLDIAGRIYQQTSFEKYDFSSEYPLAIDQLDPGMYKVKVTNAQFNRSVNLLKRD